MLQIIDLPELRVVLASVCRIVDNLLYKKCKISHSKVIARGYTTLSPSREIISTKG